MPEDTRPQAPTIPSPHRIAPQGAEPPDARHLKLLRICALIAGLAIFLIWHLDERQNMITAWESLGAPLIGTVYLLGSLVLWLRGIWLQRVALTCLSATSIYFVGMLHFAARDATSLGLYSLSTNAQFIPLLYVTAFVTLRRGAAAFCWVNYAAIVLLYALHHVWPQWRGLLPAPGDMLDHTWLIVLLAHPCYILALQYITVLRGRLHRTSQHARVEKQRFLAMLSHELRSPLQAMFGSIDLLALKTQQPAEKRAVDRLRHAAQQLDAHLRDVAEFSRLEDPDWQLNPQQADMSHLVRETCEVWRSVAADKALAFECEIAAAAEPVLRQIHTDPQRVRQILGNLLSNAFKYTPSGHIRVTAGLTEDGRHWRLTVSDSGVGIPPELLPSIFEPYVRLAHPRAGQVEGSGLGLAITRRLIERLGGELHVDSQPDQGTRFDVLLPLHPGD